MIEKTLFFGAAMLKKILLLSSLLAVFSNSVAFAESPEALKCEELYKQKQYKEAFLICKKSAERGDAIAQNYLGYLYIFGHSVPRDEKKGVEWYTKAAKQGDAKAQYNLGMMCSRGKGVPQDYKKAVEWYTKAAEQGDAKAQYNLGVLYNEGLGVRQNLSTAKEWFGKACDNRYLRGCDNYKRLNQQGVR